MKKPRLKFLGFKPRPEYGVLASWLVDGEPVSYVMSPLFFHPLYPPRCTTKDARYFLMLKLIDIRGRDWYRAYCAAIKSKTFEPC